MVRITFDNHFIGTIAALLYLCNKKLKKTQHMKNCITIAFLKAQIRSGGELTSLSFELEKRQRIRYSNDIYMSKRVSKLKNDEIINSGASQINLTTLADILKDNVNRQIHAFLKVNGVENEISGILIENSKINKNNNLKTIQL
jgi:hypothetical protein